ncbi:MAG TPA: tRNA (uridine(34)/cytosine(34)/5-carboxymethylaminomethyluridine(34)-2'-O)-methyltransferase TrmL [Clostridia bacterium]
MFNVVLVEPEIPQNTGNIVRTCAATNTRLHLVRPLGFEISDKYLKRAGLDYWPYVDISYYDSFAELQEKHPGAKFWYLSTKGKIRYTDVKYEENCFLVFGKETKGLPEDLIFSNYDRCVRIPMYKDLRSLNLSNSVAIVLYEALRQYDFVELR